MYGYDYENEILALLRILKYIQLYRPDELKDAVKYCRDVDTIDAIGEMAWGAFDQTVATFQDDTGEEIYYVYDGLFNHFFELNLAHLQSGNTCKWEPARKKLFDLAAFYLCSGCNTIFDVDAVYYSGGIALKIILSLDVYDPDELANAVVDFLLALRLEITALESLQKEQTTEILAFPQNTQEQEAA